MSQLGGGINNLSGNLGGSQDLYMVFIEAQTAPNGADTQVRYGTSFNSSTGEIINSHIRPTSGVSDYFKSPGVSFPGDFNGISGTFDTIKIQSAGQSMAAEWAEGGSVTDKNDTSYGSFGLCTGSSYGNFLTGGGTSFVTLSNAPVLMPYKVFLNPTINL